MNLYYNKTLIERVIIYQDLSLSYKNFNNAESSNNSRSDFQGMSDYRWNNSERVLSFMKRFNILPIQSFLIDEYDNKRIGKSLRNAIYVLIPRFVWPDKPIITNDGFDLYKQFYNNNTDFLSGKSAIAPSYTGEAYWNYGYLGVCFISLYLGLLYGLFCRIGIISLRTNNIAYLLVSYHLIQHSIFVESWIVSTYIGGLFTIMIYYIFINLILRIKTSIN